MARLKAEELKKHTLNLREGDMEALAELFPKFHPSVMVRRIVSKFVDQVSNIPEQDIDLPHIDL
jgi:predicted component of type VI protein secretion system